jgi:hypothetical protein
MGRPRGRRLPDTTAARADRSNPHQPLRPFKRASGPSWDDGQSVERWSVLLTLERLTSKPPTGRPSTCVRPPHASLQPRSGVRPPYQQPIVVVGPDEIARMPPEELPALVCRRLQRLSRRPTPRSTRRRARPTSTSSPPLAAASHRPPSRAPLTAPCFARRPSPFGRTRSSCGIGR